MAGRWVVPILLAMQEEGERFTPLQQRLGISPARLSENLKALRELGIVLHLNPYERRHPLLPEYILTETGKLLREVAAAVRLTETKLSVSSLLTKRWNFPVLFSLLNGASRFTDIKQELPLITPKMLSTRLSDLQGNELVDKAVIVTPQLAHIYVLREVADEPIRTLADDILSIAM